MRIVKRRRITADDRHSFFRSLLILLAVAALAYLWRDVPGLVDAVYGYQSQPGLAVLLRQWLGPALP